MIWQEKKFRFFTYDAQAFNKRNVQMISIHLKKHNIH